jgi:hypothetical protein
MQAVRTGVVENSFRVSGIPKHHRARHSFFRVRMHKSARRRTLVHALPDEFDDLSVSLEPRLCGVDRHALRHAPEQVNIDARRGRVMGRCAARL